MEQKKRAKMHPWIYLKEKIDETKIYGKKDQVTKTFYRKNKIMNTWSLIFGLRRCPRKRKFK